MGNRAMRITDLGELYMLLKEYLVIYDYAKNENIRDLLSDIHKEYDWRSKLGQSEPNIQNPRNAGRKPKYKKEQNEQILALRESGKTIREIAAEIPCSIGYVHKLIYEHTE